MSEHDGTQPALMLQRGSPTSKQNSVQAATPQPSVNDDQGAWKDYWRVQGQEWRTEPEINAPRQQYLAERLSIKPNIEQDIFPFKDIKLTRADIEWLLATHEEERGPVNWNDE